MLMYPNLVGEMAKNQITKRALAQEIGICERAMTNRLSGKTPFTWPEVRRIRRVFCPTLTLDYLFSSADEKER